MHTLKCLLILTLVCWSFQMQGLDLTRINLNYQYDLKDDFFAQYRVVEQEGGVAVFLEIQSDSLQRWSTYFLMQEAYSSVKHDTLDNITLDTIKRSVNRAVFRIDIEDPAESLLLICMADLSKGAYRILDVRVKSPVGFPSTYPKDDQGVPILTNYVTSGTLPFSTDNELHAFQYEDNFGASDPPMGMMKPIAPRLKIDSSFYFTKEMSGLDDFNFYLIQNDTLAENGLTLLKCPPYYPEYKRLEELIGPLTYITTPSELNDLKAKMTKKAFENFWINTYGTKFRAKSAIRYFYNQVEQANLLFTDYKQGWKTDRGMLFIVYGLPDKVMRNERSEVWYYNDGTEFEFIRISTLFTPSMYTLKRDRKYEKDWYTRVGNLRKG